MPQGSDPVWSVRGEIAFTVADHHCPDCQVAPEGELWVVPTQGGDARLLTTGAAPDWSPSGDQLAFTAGKESFADPAELHVINRDGTGQRVLYTSRRKLASPTWSPDGEQIAFVLGSDVVAAVAPEGGTARRLFKLPCPEALCEDGSYAELTDIAWQPLRGARPR